MRGRGDAGNSDAVREGLPQVVSSQRIIPETEFDSPGVVSSSAR